MYYLNPLLLVDLSLLTDRSGCREVVDDGVNGYMIKQKDTQSLIDIVEKFISLTNDERKEMGLAGRKESRKRIW